MMGSQINSPKKEMMITDNVQNGNDKTDALPDALPDALRDALPDGAG